MNIKNDHCLKLWDTLMSPCGRMLSLNSVTVVHGRENDGCDRIE